MILALCYGYIPYFILPVFAGLDRIDQSQIEAARDLGATPLRAFLHVTLPLSRPSIMAGSALVVLPMFGDYYTNDLISASPKTSMLGNEINLFVSGRQPAAARRLARARADDHPRRSGWPTTCTRRCATPGGWHERHHRPEADARPRGPEPASAPGARGCRRLLRNPWGKPRFLVGDDLAVHAWALVPVAIAILFSFNAGKSRSRLAGVLDPLVVGRPDPVGLPQLRLHRRRSMHSLMLAALDMAIATPLGVLLALGLARWRGRGSGAANSLMLVPLVTPEIVMAVSLLVVFTQLALVPFSLIHLGTTAQVVGQVTFSLSYVVVIIRSRLASIGNQYEEAARDLGATPVQAMRLVLVPLLMPAILASLLIVFALSIDDFVVTQYMSSNSATTTIPMYPVLQRPRRHQHAGAQRAGDDPVIVITLGGIALAYFLYTMLGRRLAGGDRASRRCASCRGSTPHEPGGALMPGEVELRALTKRYDESLAVDAIDATISAGEFFSLLGPSGCGKTTTLRMIAGFVRPTAGEILLDGVDVAQVPPHKRNVHTVFQNYALFPHLSVFDNVAFGLKRQRTAKDEARRRRVRRRSSWSSWRATASAGRRSCPAASSSGSRSPARSCSVPRCCCSTSRSARWTRRSASSCGSS